MVGNPLGKVEQMSKDRDDQSVLDFVSFTDLLEEIQKRTDSMIFIGQISRTESEDDLAAVFKGTLHACLGLCEVSKLMVISQEAAADDSED